MIAAYFVEIEQTRLLLEIAKQERQNGEFD